MFYEYRSQLLAVLSGVFPPQRGAARPALVSSLATIRLATAVKSGVLWTRTLWLIPQPSTYVLLEVRGYHTTTFPTAQVSWSTSFIDRWSFSNTGCALGTSFDFFWLLLTSFDVFWLLLTSFDVFWLLLTSFDFFWLLLTSFDFFWLLLTGQSSHSQQHSWLTHTTFEWPVTKLFNNLFHLNCTLKTCGHIIQTIITTQKKETTCFSFITSCCN